ncbi:uncharacterized protein LOC119571186 [Penaeus monodon]|uniref:uncharacterized protein LOC119571186 n=1 Tax=Penaeus monodon TaxID=6687 RepID=UPI0018A740CE|nr:uncharacterized protein LOC119571186 [Penaeus monodon]
MILVPKKDGSLRPVVDYHKLNALTIPDRFSIPSLRSLLQDVGKGHSVFSTIDLQADFFQRLSEAGLTIIPKKCSFFRKQIENLGHTINSDGISPNSSKVKDILDFPAPNNVKQVKSFLGLLLKESPVLSFPDFNKPFVLATDASCTALGAALMQRSAGRLQPIAYVSRKLNAAEPHYSVTDLEALAVVWSLKHFRVLTDHRPLCYLLTNSKSPTDLADDVRKQQREDPLYSDLITLLEANPSLPLPRRSHIPNRNLFLEDGLLFRCSALGKGRGSRQRHTYNQLVIPETLVPTGSVSVPSPALTYDIPDRPFQRISVDVLSGFSVSATGNRYLLVFIDNFSRFCELVPIPDKSATTVARAFLENVICRHNTPDEIVSDNGSEFNNSLLHSLCSMLRIKKINILPYRPQANGITERLNRTILSMLQTSLASSTSCWDVWVPIIQMAINSTYHSSLGDTPHFIIYGEDRPYDLLEQRPLPVYDDN